MLFLGIDAGGSNCRARIEDDAGATLGEGRSGPANFRIGLAGVIKSISTAYQAAMAEASLEDSSLQEIAAGIGVAGIDRDGAAAALADYPWPFASIKITSDAEIANLGAHNGEDGGIVIVGTGSIGIAKLGNERHRVGGYGFPVSDSGSGAYMGLQAVRAALQAKDCLIASGPLTDQVLRQLAGHGPKVSEWLDNASATDFAGLAPLVVLHAEENDPVAMEILRRSAGHIGGLLNSLGELGVQRLTLTGGLAPIIRNLLEPGIKSALSEPLADPLSGAILLAKMAA